jgi:hypothetical protein
MLRGFPRSLAFGAGDGNTVRSFVKTHNLRKIIPPTHLSLSAQHTPYKISDSITRLPEADVALHLRIRVDRRSEESYEND